MKRIALTLGFVIVTLGVMLAVAWLAPLPLEPFLDFQVLYRADSGLLRGIPLYDLAGQEQMVANDLGVAVERVFVLPFPYPPWYALATLPIALLPISIAVRMWFLLNTAMLMLSAWLITDGWTPRSRLISFVLAPLFFPSLGALMVGQYVFPTMLGMAMMVYALRQKNAAVLAVGMALTTFKPHVGAFALLAVAVHLLLRRDDFGARALKSAAVTGLFLFAIGFLADGNWVVNYWGSLFAFKDASACRQCDSLPMAITQLVGFGFDRAFLVSLALLIGLVALLARSFPRLQDGRLVALFTCMMLLVNPYLQNYDFAFVWIPLMVCAGFTRSPIAQVVALLAFILPWVGFVLWGSGGGFTMLVLTAALMVVVMRSIVRG
ncbi:MAG TPA: glycosyltransferase family 87 protein [Anaerolineales bacterium]|nr:glycosyltransferase family 87 protein [Anaerolineales bacterium]